MPALPPELSSIPTIVAEPWLLVDPSSDMILEGPAFDRNGNLFVTAPTHGLVFEISSGGGVSTIFEDPDTKPCGSAVHRDGRLFVGCLDGELLILDPDGRSTFLRPAYEGRSLSINDLVFDGAGNLYITDFRGSAVEPAGGVYRLGSDGTTVVQVLSNLASPNGISLSPAGDVLWVAETTRNTVVRIGLMPDGITLNPVDGVVFAYYSTGCPGPDSNKVDREGNVYQCIMGQGRVVILSPNGVPLANVVVQGREEGRLLRTANLAFAPGTDRAYLTTSGVGGACICTFPGLAPGLDLFSHRTS